MNYSLGNMLGGAGALNADKLALNLQFATDKTLTARKGPTPVFTRASTATFVGSDGLIQSAAINQARFDHDPVTLASRGLLIEESRTNLILQSGEFSSTWAKAQSTVTADATNSPSGSLTADKIIPDTSNTGHNVYQARIGSIGSVTGSFFAKAAGYNFASLQISDSGVSRYVIVVNLTTGAITQTQSSGSPTGISTSVIPYADGWYRISLTMNATVTGIFMLVSAIPTSTVSYSAFLDPVFTGDGTSGIFAWGAQLEEGAFPTSYIPTTTASVVRSADICTITGSSFTGMYNQSEGTLLTQSTKTSTNSNSFIAAMSDNSFNNSLDLRYSAVTTASSLMNFSNVNQFTGFSGAITSGSSPKQAIAYKLNDCAYSLNGASAITDTSASIPTFSQLNIGNAYSNNLAINGHIASIRYYKKRLANAKIQALTV